MKQLEIERLKFEAKDESVELLKIVVDGYGNKRIIGYRVGDGLIAPCIWDTDGAPMNGTYSKLIPVDKFKKLKQAFKEGALIEYANNVNQFRWDLSNNNKPDWTAPKYRIKGDITISQWNRHREVIKAFWRDEEIECKDASKARWQVCDEPKWHTVLEYRVKPPTQELSVAEISERLGYEVKIVK